MTKTVRVRPCRPERSAREVVMHAKDLIGMGISTRKAALISALAATGLASLPAAASTIALTGTGQMTWTAQFLGTSSSPFYTQTTPNTSLDQGNNYSLSV